jgi:HEAT repeat protein
MPTADPLDVLYDLHAQPKKRRNAALALGRDREKKATEIMLHLLENESDFKFRMDVAHALGDMKDSTAVDTLIQRLSAETQQKVRRTVAQSLGKIGDNRALAPLIHALKEDPHYLVRYYAAEALGRLNDESAIEPLIAALKDRNGMVCWNASHALAYLALKHPKVIECLIPTLKSRSRSSQMAILIINALSRSNQPVVIDTLIEVLNEGAKRVPARTEFKNHNAKNLYSSKQFTDAHVRELAARALGNFGDKRAVEALRQRFNDPNEHPSLRPHIVTVLKQLGEQP